VSAVTNEGEEGCEGGRCVARLLSSMKVRVHITPGRDALCPDWSLPPDATRPSHCSDWSSLVTTSRSKTYTGQDQSELAIKTGRDGSS